MSKTPLGLLALLSLSGQGLPPARASRASTLLKPGFTTSSRVVARGVPAGRATRRKLRYGRVQPA